MKYRDWLTTPLNTRDLIRDASSRDGKDSPQRHIIGLSPVSQASLIARAFSRTPVASLNSGLCYCNFSATSGKGRPAVVRSLDSLSFLTRAGRSSATSKSVGYSTYFASLLKHKFCISPEGNGEDCYRHYEALLAKSIPIIQQPKLASSYILSKYARLPVLFTEDYSELTEDYLIHQYNLMLDTEYNFEKLKLSYWKNESPNSGYRIGKNIAYWDRQRGQKRETHYMLCPRNIITLPPEPNVPRERTSKISCCGRG